MVINPGQGPGHREKVDLAHPDRKVGPPVLRRITEVHQDQVVSHRLEPGRRVFHQEAVGHVEPNPAVRTADGRDKANKLISPLDEEGRHIFQAEDDPELFTKSGQPANGLHGQVEGVLKGGGSDGVTPAETTTTGTSRLAATLMLSSISAILAARTAGFRLTRFISRRVELTE